MTIAVDDVLSLPQARSASNITSRRPYLDLFLVSFLILFFELACIRWFGSTVIFLTFFTNIVLMASFLGMSVGLLTATRRQNFMRMVLPMAVLSAALAMLTYEAYMRWGLSISVGHQQKSPQQIYFGTEFGPGNPRQFMIPVEVMAGLFFALIAVTFVGLGQTMGRAFDAIPNRVAAYTVDVMGSLCGIVAFGLMSWRQLTPLFWFVPIVALCLYFVRGRPLSQWLSAGILIYFVTISSYGMMQEHAIYWSPYYRITYVKMPFGLIDTNHIAHQVMLKTREDAPAYLLPHLLNRDAGGKPFADCLIIGAGSGNDVSAALSSGARHIDAVEIDPVINAIGRRDHPEHPYDDPRVSIHLDDGRSFVRKTPAHYDLAIYALVDSLVLHSGYSSIRLESFLFTDQAFRDIKAKLKPGGVFAMYNYYRQGWVIARLAQMAENVFGTKPLVISLPYQQSIDPSDSQGGRFTCILVGADSAALEKIRHQFEQHESFWINGHPSHNDAINGFAPAPPTALPGDTNWQKIAPAQVSTAGINILPTDDWPQLYLHEPRIPTLNLRGMLLIAALSLAILFAFAPQRAMRPDGRMFFLGAGFMLLETKGVVHMALLFGSTWVVNSVVFFAILVMILGANLFVLTFKPKKTWPYYLLLLAALLLNAVVPMDTFLSMNPIARTIASCAMVFVPIFFAGVIFAASFRDTPNPSAAFGSNIAGIILGGLSENLSLVLGFNHLLLVAAAFYALSALLKPAGLRRPIPAMPR